MRSSSWRKMAAWWINWRHQLCNGQGGSDEDNGNADDNGNVETTTMTTTTTAVGNAGINTGMDAAAAIHQGSMMWGKHSQHKRWCQHLTTNGIGTLQRRRQGQYCHAGRRTARREWAAEGARRARVEKLYSYQQEQTGEQNCFKGSVEGGLSKVAHKFGGRSPCGGGNRASGSVGTGWAVSIVLFFAIIFEWQ